MELSSDMIRFNNDRIWVDEGRIHLVHLENDQSDVQELLSTLRSLRSDKKSVIEHQTQTPFVTPVLEGLIAESPHGLGHVVVFKGMEKFHDFQDWQLNDAEWKTFFGHRLFVLLSKNNNEGLDVLSLTSRRGQIVGTLLTPHVPIVAGGNRNYEVELVNGQFRFSLKTEDIFRGTDDNLRIRGNGSECRVKVGVRMDTDAGSIGAEKMGELRCGNRLFPNPEIKNDLNDALTAQHNHQWRVVKKSHNDCTIYNMDLPVVELDGNRFIFFDKKNQLVYGMKAGQTLEIEKWECCDRTAAGTCYQPPGGVNSDEFVVVRLEGRALR